MILRQRICNCVEIRCDQLFGKRKRFEECEPKTDSVDEGAARRYE